MFQLKEYQQRCLDELAEYFRRVIAFQAVTDKPERMAFEEADGRAQYQPVKELPGLPYVCLRVPTGGGKTVMASHAVGLACKEYLQRERCLVFWLAPTTQIVSQTVKALRDKRHPYRQALDAAFGGRVSVMDLSAATTNLKPADLSSDTVVIVSTIQAPRVGDKEGRKVYTDDNGYLMDHFEHLKSGQLDMLDKTEAGKPAYSLANVFKLHRPVVIVDEAHNARTDLSFETLARFNPSCIIELTATPAADSNVLTSVSASELKAEEMIKLPIRLHTRPQWKEAIQEALAMQAKLEKLAIEEEKATGEYIRPIVLLQAQSKGKGNVTFEELQKSLQDDFSVPEEQIAIATGKQNDLEDLDVLARDCEVRFIITVAKLREGWDCPFAYVLCSVSNLTSRTAVEQIMGRVLRMPHAERKKHDELNHAYAFVTSEGFVDAANALTDALIDSGFDPFEAKANIKPQADMPLLPDMPLWHPITELLPSTPTVDAIPKKLRDHIQTAPAKSAIDTGAADMHATMLQYAGPPITKKDESSWVKGLESDEEKKAVARLARKSRGEDAWPAALGERFEVPVLAVREGKQLELFEDQFREGFWKLSECEALLAEDEFKLDGGAQTGAEIDVEKGKVSWHSFTDDLHRQLSFLDSHGPGTAAELAIWLDRAIPHPDVTQAEAGLFMKKAIDALMDKRGFSLEELVANRFRLRDAVAEKIRHLRKTAAKQAFSQMLLPEYQTPLEVSPELCFRFPLNQYPAPAVYEGSISFNKHYYELPAKMNGEEADCAAFIDSMPEVEFWVRNLERDQYAFWLQTSTDKFYPDFVAKLKDGRFLAVEYKGSHLETSADTEEKDTIGQLWAARSNGQCVFVLATRNRLAVSLREAVNAHEGD
jgi:type III restriction enzyme